MTGSLKYFSPELYQAYNNYRDKIILNPFKSDAFSLGLILLELGILEVPKENSEALKQGINKLNSTYEKIIKDINGKEKLGLFIKLLTKCLKISPLYRSDFLDLYFNFQRYFGKTDSNGLRIQIMATDRIKHH